MMGHGWRWLGIVALLLMVCLLAVSPAISANAEAQPLLPEDTQGLPLHQDAVKDADTYEDESISVHLERIVYHKVECIVARIKLTDPCQLRTVMANNSYNDTEIVKANVMSKQTNAVLAINGDYFKFNHSGYLVRQGEVYRERAKGNRDVLLIDHLGNFHGLVLPDQAAVDAYLATLDEGLRVMNSFNFGPILVVDGVAQPITTQDFQPRQHMQRVALAQVGELEYMVFQCTGATDQKTGLTMADFANFIVQTEPNVKLAYNLDGGGSCQIFFLGERANYNPDTRRICDMVYFASIQPGGEGLAEAEK